MAQDILNKRARFLTIADGTDEYLPPSWRFASIYPGSGASYTLTNGGGETIGPVDIILTIPEINMGWEELNIAATGGSVYVVYCQ